MGLYVHNPNPNVFVRFMRKFYNNVLQFKKGYVYFVQCERLRSPTIQTTNLKDSEHFANISSISYNFVLWFIFAGALFGFALARLEYLDINNRFKAGAAPGEWFYYGRPFYKAGMLLHLATVLPAGILVPWQFVPAIRYNFLTFHRINGYLLVLLLLLGNVGALMIARYAFGGTMATQSLVGVLAILTTASALLAYVNVKRLQIDQHRAWMIRTWVYMGTIVTTRIIQVIAANVISNLPGYFSAMPCRQIESMGGDASRYAACASDMAAQTAVEANFANPAGIENVSAAMHMSFGMAAWISLALHAIGVEVYLRLTPAEDERLRRVSYERQLERGFSHPGSAGFTADRLGDAHQWTPPSAESGTEKARPKMVQSESEISGHESDGVQKPAAALGCSDSDRQ